MKNARMNERVAEDNTRHSECSESAHETKTACLQEHEESVYTLYEAYSRDHQNSSQFLMILRLFWSQESVSNAFDGLGLVCSFESYLGWQNCSIFG